MCSGSTRCKVSRSKLYNIAIVKNHSLSYTVKPDLSYDISITCITTPEKEYLPQNFDDLTVNINT